MLKKVVVASCMAAASATDPVAWYVKVAGVAQPTQWIGWEFMEISGAPKNCEMKTVLADNKTGWAGQCLGLLQVAPPINNSALCQKSCEDDVACSVWQFTTDEVDGCYKGQGHSCGTRQGEVPVNITGAQRIQRGDVVVLRDITDIYIYGLSAHAYQSGTAAQNQQRCRQQCYSDIYCQFWQMTADEGCRVSGKLSTETPPATPALELITDKESNAGAIHKNETGTDNKARDVQAGEFIQHRCTAAIVQADKDAKAKAAAEAAAEAAAAAKALQPKADNSSLLYVGLVLLALLVASVAAWFLCCQNPVKKPRAVKKTRAVKLAPKEPESVPLVPLMQFQGQYPGAPTYAPMQQFQSPYRQ